MIAQTILAQLGGNRFIAMTGAKNLTSSDNALSFKIGRNSSRANCVRIELTPSDTYTMTFQRAARSKTQGFQIKEVEKIEGVYCDQLQSIFTKVTGLETHL
jgi:hypothetical protein